MSLQLTLLPELAPEHPKDRGAFFTPRPMADYMVSWAIREAGDRVLEPSCGEAVFLQSAVNRLQELGAQLNNESQLIGLDIHTESIELAKQELQRLGADAELLVGDFFDFHPSARFDAVIGNPPYVRYQKFSGEARRKALEVSLAHGVRLPGLASSWAAFVVHAASCLKPAGRMALVLPGELLSVNYAAPVRRFLMQRFAEVRLVVFEERVFPGVLEEVVLVLAEGQGPTDVCSLYQAQNLDGLESLNHRTWSPKNSGAKWVAGLLPTAAADLYAQSLEGTAFNELLQWGETTLGMVTGNNKFFTLGRAKVESLRLEESELRAISPPGSKHLRGLSFSTSDWDRLLEAGKSCYLFDPDPTAPSEAAQTHIQDGERQAVHTAYKCRVRKPWWVVPKVSVPDLLLTYMNHDTPRLVSNSARCLFLNSVHGVYLRNGLRKLGSSVLPVASLNSLTLLGAELVGRSYGGGMLKLEPKEADKLPVPAPECLEALASELRDLKPSVAQCLEAGDLDAAVKLVDQLLLHDQLGLSNGAIQRLSEARQRLFQRRVTRGRGA
ncbi:MAG: N-6 DNA methylase [Acidobacteriota bacterium]|nr:N-6 DNA methylase [Acidobacteriota bacterium]